MLRLVIWELHLHRQHFLLQVLGRNCCAGIAMLLLEKLLVHVPLPFWRSYRDTQRLILLRCIVNIVQVRNIALIVH